MMATYIRPNVLTRRYVKKGVNYIIRMKLHVGLSLSSQLENMILKQ